MTHPFSLRYKLAALIGFGGLLTTLMAAAGFTWMDLNRFRENSNTQVTAIASIVAEQVGPAITLADRKSADEILATLCASRLIVEASVYDTHGACFSDGHGSQRCGPVRRDGIEQGDGILFMTRPIQEEGERLGTLMLGIPMPSVLQVLRQYAGGAALNVVLSLIVAVILALTLQARVSRPILEVANVAQRIAETHSFDERVARVAGDELGVLADSFNSMLEQIERRDSILERQRLSLQSEINERITMNTALQEAKERAEEATRLKSEFLANMSHEIRTPMNGVLGMIGLVLERSTDAESREQLEAAHAAGRALTLILNDILDLSKLDAGKMTIEAIDFDLHATVREALVTLELTARQKGISLTTAFAESLPQCVRGDPMRLRQVLLNLAGNAVKFTPEGSVRVSLCSPSRGTVRCEVADTGIGIDPSQLNAVFNAFTQADGSHSRNYGGTGLGLTITRRLVQLMGGRLWAESRLRAGSCFYFELPMEASAAAAPQKPVPAPATRLPAGLRILIAEDNPINQKVVSAMMRRQGCRIVLAANGQEAYDQYLAAAFDVILMDVQMPEVDGLQATERIRAQEQARGLRHTPILALTAHASRQQHEQCLACGMDAVITKPVSQPEVLRRISEVVAANESPSRSPIA